MIRKGFILPIVHNGGIKFLKSFTINFYNGETCLLKLDLYVTFGRRV